MNSSEFTRHLEKDPPAPVYLFVGADDLVMEEAWKALVERFVPAKARRYNGERWLASERTAAQVVERLSTITMFGSKQLLMVRDVDAWNKENQNLLMSYVGNPVASSCLVAATARKKGIEKLESAVGVRGLVVQFPPLTERDAPRWVQERTARHGKQIGVQAAGLLVEMTGVDRGLLGREVEKLAYYVGDRARISEEDVREATRSNRFFTVFEMLRFIGQRRTEKAVTALRGLILAGESPLGILALLSRQIRMVWQVKDGFELGLPSGEISRRLKLYPAAFKEYSQQVEFFTQEELYEIHEAIREADKTLKSTGISPEAVVESLVLELCLKKKKNP